jgi:hypothetical protein
MTLLPLPQILPYEDPCDPALAGRAVAGYGHLSLAALPWHLKEEQSEDGVTGVKASSTRRVLTFEENVHAAAPLRLYAKRNTARSAVKAFGYRLYRSKARREWDIGWALVRRGILTGRPVIVAERRRLGAAVESYLVTEAIAAERTLLDHLRLIVRERGGDPAPTLTALAGFVHSLHAAGFYHDDLSAEHIWVKELADHRTIAPSHHRTGFGLIDLDQSRFTRITRGRVLMNLFQVLRSIPKRLLTPEQRLSFLAAFFADSWPMERDGVLRSITEIERKKGARDVLG